jgi:hypothetical protein
VSDASMRTDAYGNRTIWDEDASEWVPMVPLIAGPLAPGPPWVHRYGDAGGPSMTVEQYISDRVGHSVAEVALYGPEGRAAWQARHPDGGPQLVGIIETCRVPRLRSLLGRILPPIRRRRARAHMSYLLSLGEDTMP